MNSLKAEYLTVNKPFVKNVKYQRYYSCSMLTPNSFPVDMRDMAKNQDIYGFKFHGVYENEKDQESHLEKLRDQFKNHEVFGDKIGELIEFDVDLSDTKRTSKIVYKEEEQNELNNSHFRQELSNTSNDDSCEKTLDLQELMNFNPDVDVDENYFSQKDQTLAWNINEAKFGCVSFYTADMVPNISNNLKNNKKIVCHIVHGFFEKIDDAQKFVYLQRKKYPMIFIMEVGHWCAFDSNLKNNLNGDLSIERNNKLNDFMKLYLDALEKTSLKENERKKNFLKNADVLEKNPVKMNDENEKNNENEETNNKFTEEEEIDKKLEEIKLRKAQLEERISNKSNISEEEMERKFDQMNDLFEKLNE